ncbi:archaemetzincin-2-like [Glandiceps talaboti]
MTTMEETPWNNHSQWRSRSSNHMHARPPFPWPPTYITDYTTDYFVTCATFLCLLSMIVKYISIMRKTPRARRVRVLIGDIRKFDKQVKKLFLVSEVCLEVLETTAKRIRTGNEWPGNDPIEIQAIQIDKLFSVKSQIPRLGRQSFPQWKVVMEMDSLFTFNLFRKRRMKTLFLQPLGEFPNHIRDFNIGTKSLLHLLHEFAAAFFLGMKVELQEEINIDTLGCTSRYHHVTGQKQVLVTDLNSKLKKFVKHSVKNDLVVGLSWTDLYPCEELNFVLGEASYKHRSAVFSFGRYEPKSYQGNKGDDDPGINAIDGEILWRLIKVMSHETCHVFGLAHCVYFDCAMNESGSVEEAMSQPLFLCPICLRKLQHALHFDVRVRYQALLDVCSFIQSHYPTQMMNDARMWLLKCLKFLNDENIV